MSAHSKIVIVFFFKYVFGEIISGSGEVVLFLMKAHAQRDLSTDEIYRHRSNNHYAISRAENDKASYL